MENGALLARLDGHFDVFILCDKNLRYQQNLSNRVIAIVELPTNRWPVLMNLKDEIIRAVDNAVAGSYFAIRESPGTEIDD